MTEQNLITQKNKYDKTGECIQTGLGAEQLFDQIATSKHLEVKNAKRRDNIQKHILHIPLQFYIIVHFIQNISFHRHI